MLKCSKGGVKHGGVANSQFSKGSAECLGMVHVSVVNIVESFLFFLAKDPILQEKHFIVTIFIFPSF